MIIDCFPYYDQKELLELRLKLLYEHVDKFIISEGNHTHSGNPRRFTAKETILQLGIPLDKVEIVPVQMLPKSLEDNVWIRKCQQRNVAARFINKGDIAIISDCNEIINPQFIQYYCDVVKSNSNNILRIPLAYLRSKANLRVFSNQNIPVRWARPFMCMSHHIRLLTLSRIRESYNCNLDSILYKDIFTYDNGIIEDAGWYFSSMGNHNKIKEKESTFINNDQCSLIETYTSNINSINPLDGTTDILRPYPTENLPDIIDQLPAVKKLLL